MKQMKWMGFWGGGIAIQKEIISSDFKAVIML